MNDALGPALLLVIAAAVGSMAAVLHGMSLFRAWIVWLGVIFGGLVGWTVGSVLGGSAEAGMVGAIALGLLGGLVANFAERILAGMLGAWAMGVIALSLGALVGLDGLPLLIAGGVGVAVGALAATLLHEVIVVVAIAAWGVGFLRLLDVVRLGSRWGSELHAQQWLEQPSRLLDELLGPGLENHALRALTFAGYALLAFVLHQLRTAEIRGDSRGGGAAGALLRVATLCWTVALIATSVRVLMSAGVLPREAAWLSQPAQVLGLDLYLWPGAALVLWFSWGWSRGLMMPGRLGAAVFAVAVLALANALAFHLVKDVALGPLLEAAFWPDSLTDPDLLVPLTMAVFVALAGGRRRRRDKPSGKRRGEG